jgi:hypothetical protein
MEGARWRYGDGRSPPKFDSTRDRSDYCTACLSRACYGRVSRFNRLSCVRVVLCRLKYR